MWQFKNAETLLTLRITRSENEDVFILVVILAGQGCLKCQQMTMMLVVLLYTESGVYFLCKQILDQSAAIV
jgi:hypothetical protein